ncbi:MAG: radical SAM family heme chaperone HemW [Gammaproteobacteria bacterium]
MGDIHFAALPPLTLYIHIPWCVKKCPYCDFNSHQKKTALPEDAYISALLEDLETEIPGIWGRTIESIFIGGGTPSLFSAQAIDRLLAGIRARVPLKPGLEITLEANPGTVEETCFAEFRQAGVNRLSLGIQSFQDKKLSALGRIHTSVGAQQAIQIAQNAGFDNLNLDLMYGLPGQTVDDALADLQQALAYTPGHLSWYQLTLEPNTLFYQQPPKLPGSELIWNIQQAGQQLLQTANFKQYEVSAYCRHRQQCHHNVNYWEFGDYVGIGAGAHGKISDAASQSVKRTTRLRHPDQYLAGHDGTRVSAEHHLSSRDLVFEYALNRLRLLAPFTYADFTAATGLDASRLETGITQAVEKGFLVVNAHNQLIQLTHHGRLFLDDLVADFLAD